MFIYKRILLLEKCPEGKISPENFFLDILSDMEIKIDKVKYPNSIFFFKNDEVWMEQDLKKDRFWCDYNKIWTIFKNKFGFNDNEISLLIKGQVEKRFKMRVSAPLGFFKFR